MTRKRKKPSEPRTRGRVLMSVPRETAETVRRISRERNIPMSDVFRESNRILQLSDSLDKEFTVRTNFIRRFFIKK